MCAPDTSPVLRPAAYLCGHPHSPMALNGQREALTRFAAHLGLPAPVVYLDHAHPSSWGHRARPQFEALVRAVMEGTHRLLLIPGPWVFSVDEQRVRLSVRVLTAAGCARILVLPRSFPPVRPGPPPPPADGPPGRIPRPRRPLPE
ncbi:hypothetical protein ACWDRR_26310 [Kitasatospora sp. NPDC003701]